MKRNRAIQSLVLNAMLIALGIIFPIVLPGIRVEPFFSYTLASHVPLMVAMFLGPKSTVFVAVGTAIGFVFSTGNHLIVARALSHVVFATIGSLILMKNKSIVKKLPSRILFNVSLGAVHGLCEFLVIIPFVLDGLTMSFLGQMFLFLGLGTVVHSVIDFVIAIRVSSALKLVDLK